MKFNIEIEMTPAEAKELLNVPDLGKMIEAQVKDMTPIDIASIWKDSFLITNNPYSSFITKQKAMNPDNK